MKETKQELVDMLADIDLLDNKIKEYVERAEHEFSYVTEEDEEFTSFDYICGSMEECIDHVDSIRSYINYCISEINMLNKVEEED